MPGFSAPATIFKQFLDFRTPHDSKHLHGWRGREHRHWTHPQISAVQPVSEGLGKIQGQAVRQAPYRRIAASTVCWESALVVPSGQG